MSLYADPASATVDADDVIAQKEEEIEALKLGYGDQVLKTIAVEHERRDSERLAQSWQHEAEQLQGILVEEERRRDDLLSRAHKSKKFTSAESSSSYSDIEDTKRDGGGDDVDAHTLKERLQESQFALGDSYLAAARIQQEKRESLKHAQVWKRKADEMKQRLVESEGKRQDDIVFEKRKSQLLSDSFRTEITDLRTLLGDDATQVATTTDTGFVVSEALLDTSMDSVTLGGPLPDSELQTWREAVERLDSDRRQSVLLAEKWKREAETFRGLFENSRDTEVTELEEECESARLTARIWELQEELTGAKKTIDRLESEKLELLLSTSKAIDKTRDFVALWSKCTSWEPSSG